MCEASDQLSLSLQRSHQNIQGQQDNQQCMAAQVDMHATMTDSKVKADVDNEGSAALSYSSNCLLDEKTMSTCDVDKGDKEAEEQQQEEVNFDVYSNAAYSKLPGTLTRIIGMSPLAVSTH